MIDDATTLREYWEDAYTNKDTQFDVATPDRWIATLEKSGKIRGKVLDAGCGPGRTTLYLAELGYDVLGVDISSNAIQRAKQKAAIRGNKAKFLRGNLCDAAGFDGHFDTVIDIGCFHSLPENERLNYAVALHNICSESGVIFLRAFSSSNLKNTDWRRDLPVPAIREEQIRDTFESCGWRMRTMNERHIKILVGDSITKNAYCWFAEIEK